MEMVTSKRTVLSIQEIESAFRPVLQTAGALKAILYGSYARGEADEYSDIDLIIVANTERRFVDRYEDFWPLVKHAAKSVDLLVYTPSELEEMIRRHNPFIARVLEEGVVIYEAGQV